jgi:hypothetical protein
MSSRFGMCREAEIPTDNTDRVGVNDRNRFVECKATDGASYVVTNAWQLPQTLVAAGNAAIKVPT